MVCTPQGKRWNAERKAQLVDTVNSGTAQMADVCAQHGISVEEFQMWQRARDKHGIAGLRVRSIQQRRRAS